MAPVVHRLRVRYNECDAQGHVFNANYFTYFDVALTELWRETLGSYEALTAEGLDLVVAETGACFHAPARFDDELEIALEVERLGNTSMVSAIEVRRDGDMLAEGRIVHIFVRAERLGEKAPIPDYVRRILQPYTVEDPDSPCEEPDHRELIHSGIVAPGKGPGWIGEDKFSASYLAGFQMRHPPGL